MGLNFGGKKAKQVFFGWIDLSSDLGGYSEQIDHSVGSSHVSRPRSSVVLLFLVQGFFSGFARIQLSGSY